MKKRTGVEISSKLSHPICFLSFLLAFCMFFDVACSPATVFSSQITLTAISSATNISPGITSTPTVQPTSPATETPIPISWTNEFAQPVKLDANRLKWSPATDEFLLSIGGADDYGLVQAAAAPFFNPITLTNRYSYVDDFTWSPDGKRIFNFGRPPARDIPAVLLWSIRSDGSQFQPTTLEIGMDMNAHTLEGWLDTQTLIYTTYAGGGHIHVDAYDVVAGKKLGINTIIHGRVYLAQHGYIPATSDSAEADPHLLVIAPGLPRQEFMRADGSFRLLPDVKNVTAGQINSIYEDWLDGKNQLLVFWGYTNEHWEPQETDLLLWNLEANSVKVLAPDGLAGRFSRDGKNLVYMTFGAAKLNGSGKPVKKTSDPVSDEIFIQLLDLTAGRVFLSLPSFAIPDYDDLSLKRHQFVQAAFSPDSRYLAFLTPAEVQVDAKNWPIGIKTESANIYLNVLDLQSRKLIWSTLTDQDTVISWAPTSKFLVAEDQNRNPILFNPDNGQIIVLAENKGLMASNPDWSFDGRYLSLAACISEDKNKRCSSVYIFDITGGR